MKNLLKKFKEPSTWAGLGVLALLCGAKPDKVDLIVQVGPNMVEMVADLLAVAAGAVAVAVSEKSGS